MVQWLDESKLIIWRLYTLLIIIVYRKIYFIRI